ncbi:hypothetical protein ACFO5Q_13965 [Kordiimonas lipolytica]|uniref:Uncharacterized protein n=1 Tax=Kordiimonas lipolytica TaxID=1662421 RepID=A0ABV8UE82_9PROT|nr:hypothetical protein [Kordiimonas lipolytica]
MSIPQSEVPKHWNYFLMLENDLAQIARYIEFHEDNYETYSLELSRLLVSACGEVDAAMKQICSSLGKKLPANPNIETYREVVSELLPKFASKEVSIPRFGLMLTPWSNWLDDEPKRPNWWKGHNGIKHSRHTEFQEGNLKNVLNAMGALYIALACFYSRRGEEHRLPPVPSLYFPKGFYGGETFAAGFFFYNFIDFH